MHLATQQNIQPYPQIHNAIWLRQKDKTLYMRLLPELIIYNIQNIHDIDNNFCFSCVEWSKRKRLL